MRIVAGTLGGRVLRAPRGAATTRPTSEKVRQAIFNLLGPPAGEVHALDLFAGSGALGLEALSRGAASATFVERDRAALTVLGENLTALGVGDRATVVASDVTRFLAACGGPVARPRAWRGLGDVDGSRASPAGAPTRDAPRPGPPWTWVFLDPPYAAGVYEATLAGLPRARLSPDVVIAVEHAHRAPPPDRVGFLLRTDLRRYGDTALSRYRLEAP